MTETRNCVRAALLLDEWIGIILSNNAAWELEIQKGWMEHRGQGSSNYRMLDGGT